MKQIINEQSLVQLAKEQFKSIMLDTHFISDVKIKKGSRVNNSFFCDFQAEIYVIDSIQEAIEFCVDVKINGERRFARNFVEKINKTHEKVHWVFAAPYITPETGEILKKSKVSYFDLAGNCFISARNIIISYDGKPNRFIEHREKKEYLSRTSIGVSTVLRTMLSVPDKWWLVKDLSSESGKSMGTVSNVKAFLASREWIEEENRLFRIKNIRELLANWAKDYNVKKTTPYQYYSLDSIPEIEKRISIWSHKHEGASLLGSFSAAARYAPTVRYQKVYVCIKPQFLDNFEKDLEIQRVENGGNILISMPYDETEFIDYRTVNDDYITSPVQTILDLMGESGRGEEAADAIILKEYGGDKH